MVNCLHGRTLGIPQGSILDPLLSLIYVSDLSDDLTTNARLFADDVSLFSESNNINMSATNLNSDLRKINSWTIVTRNNIVWKQGT